MEQIYIAGGEFNINLTPANKTEEVLQNLNMLIATPKYTVPLDRNFGISWDSVDKPIKTAQALISSEIMEAAEMYEPRAEIINITFEQNELSHKLTPRIEVIISE